MKRIACEVGSVEWRMARLGIPTASRFDEILTPKSLKISQSMAKYAHQLVAEQLLGVPLDDAESGFMQRGTVLEKRALDYYRMVNDVEVEPAGFFMLDDESAGATPDFLIGADGLGEIKVPAAHTHIGYLLDGGIDYRCQTQGQLWVAEREWVDTLSWHPELPPALVRVTRDEDFIKALAAAVRQCNDYIAEVKVKLQKHGLFEGFQAPLLKVVA